MKKDQDKTKKQPNGKSETFHYHVAKPKDSQPEHTVTEGEPHDAHINVGLDILGILDALPFYVLLIDEHHYILEANKAVKTQLDLEPKDIISKYCPKIIHGLDEPFYACPLEEAVKKSEAVEREAFDPASGRWIKSAIYPTGGFAIYGLYPEYADLYALHIMFLSPEGKAGTEDCPLPTDSKGGN